MKKYTTTLFALALAIGSITFVGCGGEPAEDPKEGEDTGGEGGMTQEEKDKAAAPGFTTGRGGDTNASGNKPK